VVGAAVRVGDDGVIKKRIGLGTAGAGVDAVNAAAIVGGLVFGKGTIGDFEDAVEVEHSAAEPLSVDCR
jgi:hypothetical protein